MGGLGLDRVAIIRVIASTSAVEKEIARINAENPIWLEDDAACGSYSEHREVMARAQERKSGQSELYHISK